MGNWQTTVLLAVLGQRSSWTGNSHRWPQVLESSEWRGQQKFAGVYTKAQLSSKEAWPLWPNCLCRVPHSNVNTLRSQLGTGNWLLIVGPMEGGVLFIAIYLLAHPRDSVRWWVLKWGPLLTLSVILFWAQYVVISREETIILMIFLTGNDTC